MIRAAFLTPLLLASLTALHAAAPDLSKVNSRAELDAVIAATTDAALKQALSDHAGEILAAAERHPHVEAIIRTIESAPGAFTKINTTPDALKKATGGDMAIFDTLTQVSTNILGGKAHDHRKENADPYNAAFIEHLGHIASLESVKLEASGIQDDWVAPLLKLKKLKSLSVSGFGRLGDASLAQLQQLTECPDLTNLELAYFGKATDAGWEKLAGLKNLEAFSFVGTQITGKAYAKFDGFTKLIKVSHRGSSINDEGLKELCDHLPNLESISLAHAKFTDAGAPNLAKLTKLKGFEIGTPNATPACLKHIQGLPLESLQLGEGFDKSEALPMITGIKSLKRLTLTNCKTTTDDDLKLLATMKQLESLELGSPLLPDERLPLLQGFAFLKELKLIDRQKGYPDATQAKVKALLPKVDVKWK